MSVALKQLLSHWDMMIARLPAGVFLNFSIHLTSTGPTLRPNHSTDGIKI